MLTTVLVIIVIAIVAIFGLAAMKPDTFRVRRETDIAAPREKIFALLNDFQQWALWSPWEKMDPAMARTHSGAASGEGAVYAWEGNKKVGQGRMEIRGHAAREAGDQARFSQAFRGAQHHGFHAGREGRLNPCGLGHARPRILHGEAHARVHEHGQNGGEGFRAGSCQYEGGGGELDFPLPLGEGN